MKKTLFFAMIFSFVIGILPVKAQSVRLVRTDVEADKSHFITATYRFGIDVKVEDAGRCSAIAFELRYTNAGIVQYSGFSSRELGRQGISVKVDPNGVTSGNGKLNIGVLSGVTPLNAPANPVVIHLDFVTTAEALHNDLTSFSFTVAQAVTETGTVQLSSVPTIYSIRSFVDVFPGDANNDGVVDTRDWTAVAEFVGNNNFRGFSRRNASTYWIAQQSLAWDSAQATYADCDGTGDITLNDILVIGLNFGKRKSEIAKGDIVLNNYIGEYKKNTYPAESIKIPIFLHPNKNIVGWTGRISWHDYSCNAEVLGVEPGELFNDNKILQFVRIHPENKYADIAFCTPYSEMEYNAEKPAAYIIINPHGPDAFPLPMLQNPYGITASGLLFSLENPLSSGENKQENHILSIIQSNQYLFVENTKSKTWNATISNVLGNIEYSAVCESSTEKIPVPLNSGIYYLLISGSGVSHIHPFIVTH